MRRSCLALVLVVVAVLPSGLFARAPFALAVVDSEITTYANQFASTDQWEHTLTITPTAGNLLVVCFSMANETRAVVGITYDSFTNDFVELGSPASLTSTTGTITATCRSVVVPVSVAFQTIVVDLDGASSSNSGMVIYELSGQKITSYFDVRGTAEDTTQSHDASLSTAEANEILVGFTTGTAGAYTLDAAFENSRSNAFMVAGTRAAASATSYTMTNTSDANEITISVLLAFKQEPVGGATAPRSLLLLGVGGR